MKYKKDIKHLAKRMMDGIKDGEIKLDKAKKAKD